MWSQASLDASYASSYDHLTMIHWKRLRLILVTLAIRRQIPKIVDIGAFITAIVYPMGYWSNLERRKTAIKKAPSDRGQVRGIDRMIEDRYCIDVLTRCKP